MKTRVVVGIGDSDHNSPLRWAIDEYSSEETSLKVIHCVTGRLSTEVPYPIDDEVAKGRLILEQADVYSRERGVSVVAELREGFAGEILVECSQEADLLVIGSSRIRRFFHAPGMTVVTHCVRYALCPITIVPHQDVAEFTERSF